MKNFDKGTKIILPNDGLSYWHGHFEFKTSSEKHSWINDENFLAKGIEMRGPNSQLGGMAKNNL